MKRKILRFAKGISLIALVLAVGVWVSTYFGSLHLNGFVVSQNGEEFRPLYWEVRTTRGEIGLALARYHLPLKRDAPSEQVLADSIRKNILEAPLIRRWGLPADHEAARSSVLGKLGFDLISGPSFWRVLRVDRTGIQLPMWFLCALFAVLPLAGPGRRLIHALRNAPPAQRGRSWRENLFTTSAALCLVAFVTVQLLIQLTGKTGWSVRFTRGTTFVELAAQKRNLSLTLIREWPERQEVEFLKKPDEYRLMYPFRDGWTPMQTDSFVGFTWMRGRAFFCLDQDGAVSRLPFGKDPTYVRHDTFPYQQFRGSMFGLSLLVGVVPAWWLVRWARRRVRRYVAVRESLCVACGYSLAGNVSGVCPECGAARGDGGQSLQRTSTY